MLILVTGGAGFIGSHLIHKLVRFGHDVISLDDYSMGSKDNHQPNRSLAPHFLDYREGHTRDVAALVPESVDLIIHLGEYSRVESSIHDIKQVIASNELGTAAVFAYWQNKKCAMMYAGSSTKFAQPDEIAASPYARTKAKNVRTAKAIALGTGLFLAIPYFYNVYGPGERPASDNGTLIETFRQQLFDGVALTVVSPGTQRRTFTHVADTVDGIMALLELDVPGEFPIAGLDTFSVHDVATMFGGDVRWLSPRIGNRMDSPVDRQPMARFGWKPIRRLEWYISQCRQDAVSRRHGTRPAVISAPAVSGTSGTPNARTA